MSYPLALTTCIALALAACMPADEFESGPPNPPEPLITDSIMGDSLLRLTGENWVIEYYRIGAVSAPIAIHEIGRAHV